VGLLPLYPANRLGEKIRRPPVPYGPDERVSLAYPVVMVLPVILARRYAQVIERPDVESNIRSAGDEQ